MRKNKRLIGILIIVVLASVLRYFSFAFTDEGPIDKKEFLIGVFLALLLGILIDFILRKTANNTLLRWIIILILLVVSLLWLELAVGLFNTTIAGN